MGKRNKELILKVERIKIGRKLRSFKVRIENWVGNKWDREENKIEWNKNKDIGDGDEERDLWRRKEDEKKGYERKEK